MNTGVPYRENNAEQEFQMLRLPPKTLTTEAQLDAWYATLTEDEKDSYIAFQIGGAPSLTQTEPTPLRVFDGQIIEPDNDCEQDEGA